MPGSSPRVLRAPGGALLPGVEPGWELIGLTAQALDAPGRLLRLRPASGKITTAPVPPLLSSGAVALVVGRGQVLIRPWDFVPGYLFPRDGQAWKLTGDALGAAGPAIPGPNPGQVWTLDPDHPRQVRLVSLDGAPTGETIRLPIDRPVFSDGAGYLLVQTDHGAYDLRPHERQRITTGTVVATGRNTWLVHSCGSHQHCRLAVIDRATGERQTLPSPCPAHRGPAPAPPGTISPDGQTAALICGSSDGDHGSLYLLELTTGRGYPIHLRLQSGELSLLWAPYSRWVFTIDHAGQLTAVNAHTRQTHTLAENLPPLSQLAAS